MKNIVLGMITIFLFSCSVQKTLDEKILGKWYMSKVYELDQDVTAKHNPQNNRWIDFNSNGTFKSGGDPVGENTGKWSIKNDSTLFIDSDAGENDDSYWVLNFDGDNMKWQGAKFEFNKRFIIEHERR